MRLDYVFIIYIDTILSSNVNAIEKDYVVAQSEIELALCTLTTSASQVRLSMKKLKWPIMIDSL